MRILAALMFFVSLQAFAYDTDKVTFDFVQSEKGKVLGDQIMVVFYGECGRQRTFTWKEIESYLKDKSGPIPTWVQQSVEEMSEGLKCD
jgi:hypothetical protein